MKGIISRHPVLVFLALAAVSCTGVSLHIESLRQQIAALEEQSKTLNDNVRGISEIISATESGKTVDSLSIVEEEGSVAGFEVTFEGGATVTVYNQQSSIGVGVCEGKYYWMRGGSWLLDAAGNKIEIGAGKPLPQFRVEDSSLEVSVDGGLSWSKLEGGTVNTVTEVRQEADRVVFVFRGETRIAVPMYRALSITLEGDDTTIAAGATVTVSYRVSGIAEGSEPFIDVMTPTGWSAITTPDGSSGTISVTAPASASATDRVLVLCGDGAGRTVARQMRLVASENPPAPQDTVLVPLKNVIEVEAAGGEFTLGLLTNVNYNVKTSANWLRYISTRAVRTDYLTIEADANETVHTRTASVKITAGNFSESVQICQAKKDGYSGAPYAVCHLMPCCRANNAGTKFLLGSEWLSNHDYTDIAQVRSILGQVQAAGINIVSLDYSNPSQWDDYGQSALHGGDGNELWRISKKQIENIALVCAEKGMEFFFLIGDTQHWGLKYWNMIAEYIWNNWASFESYRRYGFGDDRPMLVVFLPGTNYARQIAAAPDSTTDFLKRFRVGTCQINDAITPTATDGWGYRNYSGSSDGKVRFACPNGGVAPAQWYRVDADEWQKRVDWALGASEYTVLGSYDDTCDGIFWGIADVSGSLTPYHKNESTAGDPSAYYNIVKKTLNNRSN